MDSWISASEYGRLVYEERLRTAERARRVLRSKKVIQLPAALRTLLLLFV